MRDSAKTEAQVRGPGAEQEGPCHNAGITLWASDASSVTWEQMCALRGHKE